MCETDDAVEGLYAIVDVPHPHGLDPAAVAVAMLGDRPAGGHDGASAVQLRAKGATTAERVAWLRRIAPACHRLNVPLIVNDDIEAAITGPADGLHLGVGDPGWSEVGAVRARARAGGRDRLLVGLSSHDLGQLRTASREPIDYLAFGPVCATKSKVDPDPVVGFDGLLEACRLARHPVVAIGGLDRDGARRCVGLGAAAVATIGALVDDDIEGVRTRSRTLARALERGARALELDEVCRLVPVLPRDQLVDLARWSDNIGIHMELGLPTRFRPQVRGSEVRYRPCDVVDLLFALDKHDDETWEQWAERDRPHAELVDLVQLRVPST